MRWPNECVNKLCPLTKRTGTRSWKHQWTLSLWAIAHCITATPTAFGSFVTIIFVNYITARRLKLQWWWYKDIPLNSFLVLLISISDIQISKSPLRLSLSYHHNAFIVPSHIPIKRISHLSGHLQSDPSAHNDSPQATPPVLLCHEFASRFLHTSLCARHMMLYRPFLYSREKHNWAK